MVQTADGGGGAPVVDRFGDKVVASSAGSDLWKMGHTQDLRVFCQCLQLCADLFRCGSPDPRVHLVKDHGERGVFCSCQGPEREHETGELAARCYTGERSQFFTGIGREVKFCVVEAPLGQILWLSLIHI